MKQLYALVLTLFGFIIVTAQTTTFTDMADMPSARSAISSANDGSNIYVTNGFGIGGGYASDIFKYDIANNSWSLLTDNTISKRFGSAAIVGNFMVVFNGFIGNNVYNSDFEVIDLSTGTVTNVGLVNPQPASAAGITSEGNTIYSFGGNTSTGYSNKLYAINTSTYTFTELAPMPIAAETKGEVVNGKLYVIGGFNGSVSDKIHVYDISTNTWTNEYTLPQGLSANATAVVGDRIYVLGDFSDQDFTGYFDTSNNTFTVTTSNLINRRHAAAEGINDELFVMGGNTTSSGSSALVSVQKANITLSIDEFNEQTVEVYPNPASDVVNLSKQVEKITLFDITGSVIKEVLNASSLNIQDIQNGLYIVTLEDQNASQTIKLIKQ